MVTFIASLVVSVLLAAAGYGYSEGVAKKGGRIKQKYKTVIDDIAKYLTNNQNLLNELTTAYQDKNSTLFNKLVMSNPMGPGYDHLIKQIKLNRDQYNEQSRKLSDKISEANADLATAQQRAAEAGTSIAGNNSASRQADQLADKYSNTTQLQQNVNGGLNEKK